MRGLLRAIWAIINPRDRRGLRPSHYTAFVLGAFLVGSAIGVSGTLTAQHFQRGAGGAKRDKKLPPRISLGGAPVPASFYLDSYVVRIHAQGNANSCVGQTGSTQMEIFASEAGYHLAFSAGYPWNRATGGVNAGISYDQLYAVESTYGDAPLTAFPADGTIDSTGVWPNSSADQAAARWKIRSWRSIAPTDRQTIEALISSGIPLGIAFTWHDGLYNQFYGTPPSGPPIFSTDWGNVRFRHSTTIIGYSAIGIEVLNSWGPQYGFYGRFILTWPMIAALGNDVEIVAGFPAFSIHSPVQPHPKPKHHKHHKKPFRFPYKTFESWRFAHHKAPISPWYKHHLSTTAAQWLKHEKRLGGIKGRTHTYRGGYQKTSFARASLFCWNRSHKCRIAR